jgi:alpha-galactosidase
MAPAALRHPAVATGDPLLRATTTRGFTPETARNNFCTVPATVALGAGWQAAVGELTKHRRLARRPHPDNERLTVIYNEYMNTLMGDPTTARLLPLVDAVAEAGAEAFCIDAGWYDTTMQGFAGWWDYVGRMAAVGRPLPKRHHRGARPDSGARARARALVGARSAWCTQPDG